MVHAEEREADIMYGKTIKNVHKVPVAKWGDKREKKVVYSGSKVKERGFNRLFALVNGTLLFLFLLVELYPMIYVVSASVSNPRAVASGEMMLFPVGFSLKGYEMIFQYKDIWWGYANTIFYTVAGTLFNLLLTLPAAYALSRKDFKDKQKRVGKNKEHFNILKFRTMRTDTPPDAPTHELSDPEKWITKTGKILRKTSLDELPQLFNILRGQMSIIGPRPALWNQFDLIEERDKYGVNNVRPGLTGWAQINGRDELEIDIKATFDGEYVEKMSFAFDIKCFIGTITSVLKSEGVVEGGTGEIKKESNQK